MLSTVTFPVSNKIPDILLSPCHYQKKTINVLWDGIDINVSGNVELDKNIENCLIDIGKGMLLSYYSNIIPVNSSLLDGSIDYKKVCQSIIIYTGIKSK